MDETHLLNTIIADAFLKGVSDIHFEASESQGSGRVFFRMDGVLREYMTIPNPAADDVIQIIKSMADFDKEDNHLSRIRRIKFKRKGLPEFHIVVTTRPDDGHGEAINLRIQTT